MLEFAIAKCTLRHDNPLVCVIDIKSELSSLLHFVQQLFISRLKRQVNNGLLPHTYAFQITNKQLHVTLCSIYHGEICCIMAAVKGL